MIVALVASLLIAFTTAIELPIKIELGTLQSVAVKVRIFLRNTFSHIWNRKESRMGFLHVINDVMKTWNVSAKLGSTSFVVISLQNNHNKFSHWLGSKVLATGEIYQKTPKEWKFPHSRVLWCAMKSRLRMWRSSSTTKKSRLTLFWTRSKSNENQFPGNKWTNSRFSNAQGQFELSGKKSEVSSIDPKINVRIKLL